VTAGLAATLSRSSVAAVYLLFLWSGLFSAHAVTQVWTVLGENLDMSLAKRLYGRLAAGGGLGAVAGAALARLLSHRVEARHMLWVAAALLAITAIGPAFTLRSRAGAAPARRATSSAARRQRSRLLEHPYVTRLLLAALIAAAVSTLIDFSFKEAIVARLPADRLPAFFATFYLVTSALGLVLQLFGVGWLVRAAGVARAPLLLPLLLLGGVLWTILTGGLGALLMLRGLDGALRGALHRPSLELLQVPLGQRLRRKAKPLIDAVGQRTGQALGALALLLPFHLASAPSIRMALAAAMLLVWTSIALDLARRYVGLLRATLLAPGRSAPQPGAFGLDGAARTTLVAALDSPREAEVSGALDLLGANGQQRLIPLRLLDHPSPAIVRLAVQTLTTLPADDGRPDEIRRARLLAALDRLIAHPALVVRSTALLRRTALAPDRLALIAAAHDATCPAVRGIALAASVAHGWIDEAGGVPALRLLVAHGSAQVRLAVAEAIADRPSPRFLSVLRDLAAGREVEVLGRVAAALGTIGDGAAIEILLTLLGRREARAAARAGLGRAAGGAFELAAAALSDGDRPLPQRANLPRALVEIDPERAPRALLDGLLSEDDGFVRYRILRALNRVQRTRPETALDEDILGRAAVAAVDSAYRYLAWRLFLDDGAARLGARRTPTWQLLRELLREKEDNAIERLFRVLALRYPRDDFRRLLRTLREGGRRARAAGRELIDNLLAGPAHTLTLALVDEVGDRERLAAIAGGAPPRGPTYRELLAEIRAEEQGGTLSSLAAHHAAELEPALPGIDLGDDRNGRTRVAHA
jgi:AAA family ATP:ADP antiporter